MKRILLISPLAAMLVLTGCNRSEKTAYNDTTDRDYSTAGSTNPPSELQRDAERAGTSAGQAIESAGREAGRAMERAGDQISAKFTEWRLNTADIEADLAAGRDIVRTNTSAADQPTGSTDRSMLKDSVKDRLQSDFDVSALKLDVNARRNGEIELEGKAQNAGQVGRAIALALDTPGVTKVTSKISLDKDAGR